MTCIPQSEQYVSSKLSEHTSHFFSLVQRTNNKVIGVLIHPTQAEIKRFVRDLSGQEMKSQRQNPFGCRATAGLTSLTWRPEPHKPAEAAVVRITAKTAPIRLVFPFPIAREHGLERLLHLRQQPFWRGTSNQPTWLRTSAFELLIFTCRMSQTYLLLAAPYSVSDILVLAQQTGIHRVYGFNVLRMACCYSLCQQYQPPSEPLDVCWLQLVWYWRDWDGWGPASQCVDIWDQNA